MHQKSYVLPAFVALISSWLAWTSLVDFFVIRTVFGIVDNFFQAGELGIAVFAKLNHLEIITSSALMAVLGYQLRKNKNALPLFVMALVVWPIPIFYFSYLTPKIMELTALWKQADLMGITAVAGIPDIQQEHQFYHNLYIGIDAVKLLLLTAMLGLGIWKQEKWV